MLLSGGIDSPVAGYLMAKRGLKLEAVHFHSYPYTSEQAKEKVIELARELTNYVDEIKYDSYELDKTIYVKPIEGIENIAAELKVMTETPAEEMDITLAPKPGTENSEEPAKEGI